VNASAFWSVIAAVLPPGLFENRQDRSFMRLLHINYRVAKKGIGLGLKTEAEGGWRLIATKGHSDRMDWSPVARWWHTEGSTEDNDSKGPVRVSLSKNGGRVDDDGAVLFEVHHRRYPNDNRRRLRQHFLASAEYGAMKVAHLEQAGASRQRKAAALVKTEARREGGGVDPIGDGAMDAAFARLTTEHKGRHEPSTAGAGQEGRHGPPD